MSGSLNEATLIGNLVADPECRRTQDGRPIVNIRLATSETWRDKSTGERKERSEFHRVVIFNEGLCKVAEQYLKKGTKVFLRGALQTRKWHDKDGKDRYSTEVVLNGFHAALVMLDGPARTEPAAETNRYAEATGRSAPGRASGQQSMSHDMNDDIPFGPEVR